VVAEAFARAMQHDHRIRDPLPWLFRTAFRLAATELKRDGRIGPLVDAEHRDAEERVELSRRSAKCQRAASRALPPLLRRPSRQGGRAAPGDDDGRGEGPADARPASAAGAARREGRDMKPDRIRREFHRLSDVRVSRTYLSEPGSARRRRRLRQGGGRGSRS
jgi:hypothetical protein